MDHAKYLFSALAALMCLTAHHGNSLAAPPSVQIYLLSSQYAVILPGQKVFLRACFSDPDLGESYTIEWDFGDGTAVNKTLRVKCDGYASPGRCTPYRYGCFSYITTSYSYRRPGSYRVKLAVIDSRGECGYDLRAVKVLGPQEVIERLLSNLDEIPDEAFHTPSTKAELMRALGVVSRNLQAGSAGVHVMVKHTLIPRLAELTPHGRYSRRLTETVQLLEALINHLSLQHVP